MNEEYIEWVKKIVQELDDQEKKEANKKGFYDIKKILNDANKKHFLLVEEREVIYADDKCTVMRPGRGNCKYQMFINKLEEVKKERKGRK